MNIGPSFPRGGGGGGGSTLLGVNASLATQNYGRCLSQLRRKDIMMVVDSNRRKNWSCSFLSQVLRTVGLLCAV